MRQKTPKFCNLELKDLNDSTGEVSFYFAAWTKDLDNETIDKGAYNKTLKENVRNIYHNLDHKHAVGAPSKFGVDSTGVYCTSKLAIKTDDGLDCYEKYKAGIIKGHSQEFETIRDEPMQDGSRLIKEVKLWGVTSVTNIPANLDTPTISIKSFADCADYLSRINTMLKSGKISDELGERFLAEYKSLSEFVSKNKAMANGGMVHCDNCKMIVDKMPENGKCQKCGQFIHKVTQHPILSMDAVNAFRL